MNNIKKTCMENKTGWHGWWANCNLLDRHSTALSTGTAFPTTREINDAMIERRMKKKTNNIKRDAHDLTVSCSQSFHPPLYLRNYNEERPHSSLRYRPPAKAMSESTEFYS